MPNIRYDIKNSIPLVTSSAPTLTSSDNTAMVFPSGSTGFDLLGFQAANVLITSGTLADADATFAVELSESDTTNGSYTAIADADLIGTEASVGFIFSEDNIIKAIGVVPRKRFLRVTVTPASNSGASAFTVAVQGVKNIIGTTA